MKPGGGRIIILFILFCVSFNFSYAQSLSAPDESNKLIGAKVNINYSAPYLWKGLPLTKGPCIIQDYILNISDFYIGATLNMFASNKDRKKWEVNSKTLELKLDTGKTANHFAKMRDVFLFLGWKKSFAKLLAVKAEYTQYAYGYDAFFDTTTWLLNDKYSWFDKSITYGELGISAKVNFLKFLFAFTNQNIVIFAPTRSHFFLDSLAMWYEYSDSKKGSYHSSYGFGLKKEFSEKFLAVTTLWADIANSRFFNTFLKDFTKEFETTLNVSGPYQITLDLLMNYSLLKLPHIYLSGNYRIEWITNENLNKYYDLGGVFMSGGINIGLIW